MWNYVFRDVIYYIELRWTVRWTTRFHTKIECESSKKRALTIVREKDAAAEVCASAD